MSHLWQHPYVNVFKHFNVQSWKKSSKEGEVTTVMDRQLKCTVHKITGSIPAGNFVQLPKTSTQSLGLTGRFMYLLFKPLPGKYFVVHVDVATQDSLVVRISFSNLFKEFKSTSTWLQFPFLCHASKGSVSGQASIGGRDHSGPAPMSTCWTVLCLDMQHILSVYLNRKYSYIKSIKLCANMLVKNIFTSDTEYDPGVTFDQVKKTGTSLQGYAPMPREMAFSLNKGQKWHDLYDVIRFPSEANKKPFDSIQFSESRASHKSGAKTVEPKAIVSQAVSDRVGLVERVTTGKKGVPRKKEIVSELPAVGVSRNGELDITQSDDGEIHIYANPDEEVIVHQENDVSGKTTMRRLKPPASLLPTKDESYRSLKPDPILKLRRIVGFGGSSARHALWTSNGTTVIYPSHAVVVAMQISNGHQEFFIGHTDKVSCIALNGNSTLLASGQTGSQSVVRVWRVQTRECLAMFKTHSHSLHQLSMSHSGGVLCGVGKDSHSKNMVVIWNIERVSKEGQVSVMAKAHTDVDICRMRIAHFDDTRMVSCGRDNVRLWRVKDGSLRSAPVNLGEHHCMDFSDCCFEAGYDAHKDPLDRVVYACSKSGHIFEIDNRRVNVQHVRRLLPIDPKKKATFVSGSGISINSMCVNEAFCVTGSDDGFLRLWPLDFKHVYLEAEHEGAVTAVDISLDGVKILAGTCTGNLGILDVSSRGYTTIMRSHTAHISSLSLDLTRRHMATVSQDHTIRVWDLDTMQQLYDFSAPKECPCAISYHPSQQVFACGFETGAVRIFNVAKTSLLAEHKQHRGKVVGLAFAPHGDYLYSAGSLGSLAIYDCYGDQYRLIRLLGNTLAKGETHGPHALAVSPDGSCVAFVGPTDFTISVVDGRSLDEMMRIDITNLGDGSRSSIDTASHVTYAPNSVGHLLVTTSSNKLLKFDARTGKILAQIDHIHRSGCSAFDVSHDGRHLVTAGDKIIKVWDYHMRLDLNFQVFIGHAEAISRVTFTPDGMSFISVGEAILIWDFMGSHSDPRSHPEGRDLQKNYFTGENEEPMPYKSPVRSNLPSKAASVYSDIPRQSAPKPTLVRHPEAHRTDLNEQDKDDEPLAHAVRSKLSSRAGSVQSDVPRKNPPKPTSTFPPARLNLSSIKDAEREHSHMRDIPASGSERDEPEVVYAHDMDIDGRLDISGQDMQLEDLEAENGDGVRTPERRNTSKTSDAVLTPSKSQRQHPPPTVHQHFKQRAKKHALAQRRYTAPPNQAGLKLNSIIGFNGNGRGNMVWHADTGTFAYTSGCTIVVEDLNSGSQELLLGHNEEISTLALQHDCQVLASASGPSGLSNSQICLWDLKAMTRTKTLSYHEHDVVCLAYSRDDRFLVSMGDYRECSVVVWSTRSLSIVTTTRTSVPMHSLRWDPSSVNEFASVGENATVLFWMLDETGDGASLNVHEAAVPEDLLQPHSMGSQPVDFTCLEYAEDSTLYIAASNGRVSAWDTRHNTCFMHWEADTTEIDVVVSRPGRLITGSASGSLRLWSVEGVSDMIKQTDQSRCRGLTMEDEMMLGGMVTTAAFDDTMDMGIVGTSCGTLWYINWAERNSMRLVSGHSAKINGLSMCDNQFLATCDEDGSVRIWSISEREQTVQFQVKDQACNCLAFSPVKPSVPTNGVSAPTSGSAPLISHTPSQASSLVLPRIVAGYSDGTVRMFDLNAVEMVLKMHPHAVAVTAIGFASDGRMILSGGADGLIAVSSPTTGITVRVISDHKSAPISCLDATVLQEQDFGVSAPQLWLAASADRRVSVWSADWSKDFCELVDWLTFPAPAFTPDGTAIKKGDKSYYLQVPPSLARFSHEEPDIVVYAGYGMQKQIQFYSLAQRKVLRTITLTHWATSLDLCLSTPLIAVGIHERLVKLFDYYEGSFQDFIGHEDSLHLVKFSPDGKSLFTACNSQLFKWDVLV